MQGKVSTLIAMAGRMSGLMQSISLDGIKDVKTFLEVFVLPFVFKGLALWRGGAFQTPHVLLKLAQTPK